MNQENLFLPRLVNALRTSMNTLKLIVENIVLDCRMSAFRITYFFFTD